MSPHGNQKTLVSEALGIGRLLYPAQSRATAALAFAHHALPSSGKQQKLGLAACGGGGTATMQLYPLQGPIAADDPTLVIEAKAKNTDGTSGTLTFRLPGKV
jgi:hypothetical protein